MPCPECLAKYLTYPLGLTDRAGDRELGIVIGNLASRIDGWSVPVVESFRFVS